MARQFTRQAKDLLTASIVDGRLSADRVKQVLTVLEQKKEPHLAAIIREYGRQIEFWQRRHQARVTSAVTISGQAKEQISQHIMAHYPAIHDVEWAEDPQLIGGLTLQVGDMWHDLSIQGDLQTIRGQLRQ